MTRLLPQAVFISHGGGPLPLLGDPGHRQMVACLEHIAATMPKPDAILVVSAHWEEPVPTITAARSPALIYDYYGFPEESYAIQYPCTGEPILARDIHRLLGNREIDARLDEARGFDHGVFVPLKIMYPRADIPCVQLSLVDTLDPAQHIEVGSALRDLASKNVLVIGSGSSFHNLKVFLAPDNDEALRQNGVFEQWLQSTCVDRTLAEHQRREMLVRWAEAPGARFCHPREEHLLPLHVCYGAAQSHCAELREVVMMNIKTSMYLW